MRPAKAPAAPPFVPRALRHHRNRLGWPRWLNLSLVLIVALMFVVPSYDASGTLFKSQNLLPLLALSLLLLRSPYLRIPTSGVATWLLLSVPVLLILQIAATLIFSAGIADAPMGIQPRLATVLKQLRDPLGAWLILVYLLGHLSLLARRDFTIRTTNLSAAAGALTLILYYVLAPDWSSANYVNPRGFLAGFEGPNSLGAAVALLIPFSLAAVIHSRSRFSRVVSIASTAVLGAMLVLSGSRGAIIALFASGGIALISALVLGQRATLRQWLIAPTVVICVVAASVIAPSGPVERLLSTDIGSLATDLSTSRRVAQLDAAVEMIKARPIFGWGLGGVRGRLLVTEPWRSW